MIDERVIYLDNNATTRLDPRVLEAMLPYFSESYGNPSSMHRFGDRANGVVQRSRAQVAELLGCEAGEVVFTSGGTEADNLAIRGALAAVPAKKHVITTKVEHPAVLSVCQWLERQGYSVTWLQVDDQGRIDLDYYRSVFREDTALVSVMLANNETGVTYPVAEMADYARSKGVIFHSDAVQGVGKMSLDLAKGMPVDLLSLSAHKFHGPKGVGALYVRRGTSLRPLVIGGHQENGRRPGTLNVPGIVGLGMAAELAVGHVEDYQTRVAGLRDALESGLLATVPRAKVNGDRENRLPNTTNISFEFIEGEAILLRMSDLGIAASSGSACTSGSLEPSHVLRAMGIPFTMVHGSVRFSLSRFTTSEEVDSAIEGLPGIVADLRMMSPFWEESFNPDVGYYV